MNKSEMILALIDSYCSGNKAKFANILGVKPQTISGWISRGSFDAELIFAKFDDISAEWLLSGQGDIRKHKIPLMVPPRSGCLFDTEVMDRLTQQAEEIGRLKERLLYKEQNDE